MRPTVVSACFVLGLVACGKYGYEARTTTITGAPMITSGPAKGEAELPRNLSSTARAVALSVCRHENHCGRGTITSCIDATVDRARTELASWNCEPAAIRARYEECLASFDALSCDVDPRAEKRALCPPTEGCGTVQARLISPGPQLEKIWK